MPIESLHKNTCQCRECPPTTYLFLLAQHCPKAIQTYMNLWREKDDENKIHINTENIPVTYLTAKAKFRHDILMLVKEGLASVNERRKTMIVELVDFDVEENSI